MKKFIPILFLIGILAVPTKVQAIVNPDSLSILSILAYQGVIESNDILVLARYNIEYTVLPTELASSTFLGRFMDGTTELSSAAPYPYNDRGYGEGAISFYWSAAEVTEASLVWGSSYTVRLQGNPSFFAVPPFAVNSTITWRPSTATAFHLRNDILTLAFNLETAWVANNVDLVSSTVEGNLLTANGSDYFSNTIIDLQLMIPSVFPGLMSVPLFDEREFTQSYAESLEDFWVGTDVDVMLTDLAAALSMPRMVFSTILLLLMGLGVAWWAVRTTGRTEFAMLSFAVVMPIGSIVGLTPMTFAGLIAAGSILAIGYVFFYRSA